MKMPPYAAAGLAADNASSPALGGRTALQGGQPQRKKPLMRKFEVAHLTPSGDFHETSRLAPALPAFEDAFAAIGRGAILPTDQGPRAIEDIWPGDTVLTVSHGPQQVLWKGGMTIVPGARNARPQMGSMTRVTADALGLGRPAPDVVLGPAARIVHRAPGIARLTGAETALVPVRDFIDQSQIIELMPIAPVHCYQLGFAAHCILGVNGLQLESLHPGAPHTLGLRSDMQALLLSLFPHFDTLADAGALHLPRIRLRDLDLFDVA